MKTLLISTVQNLAEAATQKTVEFKDDTEVWGVTYDPQNDLGRWWVIGPGERNDWHQELPKWIIVKIHNGLECWVY